MCPILHCFYNFYIIRTYFFPVKKKENSFSRHSDDLTFPNGVTILYVQYYLCFMTRSSFKQNFKGRMPNFVLYIKKAGKCPAQLIFFKPVLRADLDERK